MNVSVERLTDIHNVKAVLLDGVDVTARCIEADDVYGTVTLLILNDTGHPSKYLMDGDSIKKETLTGKVEIIIK